MNDVSYSLLFAIIVNQLKKVKSATEMNNQKFYLLITAIILASAAFWGYMFYSGQNAVADSRVLTNDGGEIAKVTMYRSEGCQCCVKWAEHMQDNGFSVEMKTVDNLLEMKSKNGVKPELASCHTAFVEGYIVEGHVPSEDVKRLIKEKPDAAGITVPGMPIGSPGMEGAYVDNYDVILFDEQGKEEIFATH